VLSVLLEFSGLSGLLELSKLSERVISGLSGWCSGVVPPSMGPGQD
jgi:hypothetical protein